MIDSHSTRRMGLLALGFCTMLLNAGGARAQDLVPEVVGEITTVIGQGVIRNPSGERPTARGQRIQAGDRIETADGGHVHIRFVDGGLVSVRPLSRLFVEEYRNASGNSLAAIKFQLEEGVVRSVTGQWGEASRDRFRLNTPIAAIGVKGTDFVVKVEQGKTSASVISGAIIMAPLEGSCAASLGPCQNERAAFLSADMQGQMLEYLQQNGTGAPRLVPSVDLLARKGVSVPQDELRRNESAVVAVAAVIDKLHSSDSQATDVLDATEPRSKPLVWLHNALGWNVPANTISETYDAEQASGRTPVVGNFFINLYRDETLQSAFQPRTSSANFRLTSVSANFTRPVAYSRPAEVVQVSNAALNVDFAGATFSTQMQFNSPSIGQEQLQANGSITQNGLFVARSTGQSLSGAFSTDGRQAGYLFEKTVTGGKVSGLTLWGR